MGLIQPCTVCRLAKRYTADCNSVQTFADSVTMLKVSAKAQELPVGVASQKRHGPEHTGVWKLPALCVSVILAEHGSRKNLWNTQICEWNAIRCKCSPVMEGTFRSILHTRPVYYPDKNESAKWVDRPGSRHEVGSSPNP